MDQCIASQCEVPCGVQCGVTNTYVEPDAAQACQACVTTNDCAAARECNSDLACNVTTQCTNSCPTQDCILACVQGKDAGLFLAYGLGAGSSCLAACGVGQYWECVGHTSPPFSKMGQTALTLAFTDASQGSPISGATVKACNLSDTSCANPVAIGTTNSAGSVTLTLPVVVPPFGFSGYFDVSSPSTSPYLFFLAYPLSEPTVALIPIPIPTRSTLSTVYAAAGIAQDLARGTIDVEAADCRWAPAINVQFQNGSADAKTVFYYPVTGAYSATSTATDRTGEAFYLNAPTGSVTIVATPLAVGHATSKTTAFVRAGTISKIIPHPNL